MGEKVVVEMSNVTKIIGKHKILSDISLAIKEGECCAIVGENGSGKSMFFKTVCGLIVPTSGTIKIFGREIGKNGVFPPDTASQIEAPGFLVQYSALTNLRLLADIQRKISLPEIKETLSLVGLDPTDKRPVRKYSMGMRQKLGLAQAIMEHPKLLVLDEPMNNLDSASIEKFRGIISRMHREEGTTVLLSSHNYTDIELLSDTVYQMTAGVLSSPSLQEVG